MIKRNRVDIGVEEQGNINHCKHVAHALGTKGKGQNLDGVTDEETRPGGVVAGIVQEDHGDDGVSVSLDQGDVVALRADSPDDEAQAHSTGGDEEKWTTTDLLDEKA